MALQKAKERSCRCPKTYKPDKDHRKTVMILGSRHRLTTIKLPVNIAAEHSRGLKIISRNDSKVKKIFNLVYSVLFVSSCRTMHQHVHVEKKGSH